MLPLLSVLFQSNYWYKFQRAEGGEEMEVVVEEGNTMEVDYIAGEEVGCEVGEEVDCKRRTKEGDGQRDGGRNGLQDKDGDGL